MRRLGDELGVDPTAVYRHFRDKAELMRAVGDRLLSEVTLDVDRDEHWRTVVITVCMRVREAMLRQPATGGLAARRTGARGRRVRDHRDVAAAVPARRTVAQCVGHRVPQRDRADRRLGHHRRHARRARRRRARAPVRPLAPGVRGRCRWTSTRHRVGWPTSLYRGTASERFAIALGHLLDGIVPVE